LPPNPTGLIIIVRHRGTAQDGAANHLISDALNEASFGTVSADFVSSGECELNRHTGEVCRGLVFLE
jgi:hypothetical protein